MAFLRITITALFLLAGCFDNDGSGETNIVKPLGEPIRQIANFSQPTKAIALVAGIAHVCAHLEDYTIKCWGDNGLGALTIQSARNSQKKYYDVSKAAFTKLTASGADTCGILKDPPYEGIPVCFGQEGESFDVPHEKVKDISTGDVTCFIKPDDTLACVGKKKWLFTSTTVSEIRAAQLPKWGIDPSSGAEGQDYSTKRFKNVKMGYQSLKICAQGHDDVVYCMGENRTTPASSIFGPQPLLDYEPGDSEFGFSLMKDGTPHLLGSPGYPKILNIKSPKLLKYKRIFAHGEGF